MHELLLEEPNNPNGSEELLLMGEEEEEEEFAGGEEGSSGWVTTKVAAAALGVATRTVRDYIQRGEFVARSEGEGVERAWLVSVESLHEIRQRRGGSRAVEDLLREVLASELVRGGPGGDVAAGAAAGPAARPLAPSDVEDLRELLLRRRLAARRPGILGTGSSSPIEPNLYAARGACAGAREGRQARSAARRGAGPVVVAAPDRALRSRDLAAGCRERRSRLQRPLCKLGVRRAKC